MKLRNYRLECSPKIMIIPMIDIIFFLLVFFMMASLHMKQEQTLALNLPHAATARNEQQQILPVTVTSAGRIQIAREEVAFAALRHRVRSEMNQKPDITVVVRADRQAEYGYIVAILDELKLAGVQRMAVATEKPR